MGALHTGHLSLVRMVKEISDVAVVSIFVNPKQFGKSEDFAAYPRDRETDIETLNSVGVDVVFLPTIEEIFPENEFANFSSSGPIGTRLEGAYRPGHFDGVVAVVSRLFDIVAPNVAVFGKKDAQQIAVVRHLAEAQYPHVQIVSGEVVRETDGLPFSSRNRYLKAEERALATLFPTALSRAAESLRQGRESVEGILSDARAELTIRDGLDLQYVELVDSRFFHPVTEWKPTNRVLVGAVRIGATRLIDAVWFDTDERKPAQ